MVKPVLIPPANLPKMYVQDYESYLPTAFDESMTLLQKVNKVIHYLDEIGRLTNEMIEKWNAVYDWVLNEGLEEAVVKQLEKWLADGTITAIFQKVFEALDARVTQNTNDIASLKQQLLDLIDMIEGIDVGGDITNIIGGSGGAKTTAIAYQHLLGELEMGFGGTQLFNHAENAPQGMAIVNHGGVDKVFILSRGASTAWESDEKQRITEFHITSEGAVLEHVAFTGLLNLSHQGLSGIVENDEIILFAGMNTGSGVNASKGYTKIKWNGKSTSDQDCTSYQLLGASGGSHKHAIYHKGTTTVSNDGKLILMATHTEYSANTRYMFVYDRETVEAASIPLNVKPLNRFKIESPKMKDAHIVQDLVCDNNFIYIAGGGIPSRSAKVINVYSISGYQVGYFSVDGACAEYTLSELNSGITGLGKPNSHEMEGIAFRNGNLVVLTTDVWMNGTTYTRRKKFIHELTTTKQKGSKPINMGYVYPESPASLHLYENKNDITVPVGDNLQFGSWNHETEEYREMVTLADNNLRIFDSRPIAKQNRYVNIFSDNLGGRCFAGFRADRDNTLGAGFNAYGKTDPKVPGAFVIYSNGDGNKIWDVRLQETGNWRSSTDGVQSMGTIGSRWDNIYATGTITTSDRNKKQQIQQIPDDVLDAWEEVEFVQFKYNLSVDQKGEEKARIHVGLIAQQIAEVFTSRGLNACNYSLVGFEVSDNPEKDGTEPIWHINADECAFMEMALMRREMKRLKDK